MANIKSQIKRNKQNEKAHSRNKADRSEIKTLTKEAAAAVGTDEAEAKVGAAIKRIDMATSKRVLHKNTAARQKSRLAKSLNTDSANTDSDNTESA